MVNIGIDELVLALGLDHVVALLTKPANNAKDRELADLSEGVFLALDVIMQNEHCLL